MTWSSAVCDITWDVTRRLLNLICVDLWEFESKKVRFVAERPLEAEQRGNLSVKLLQNDDMSRTCGLSGECYQDPTSAFWPFSQVPMSKSSLSYYLDLLAHTTLQTFCPLSDPFLQKDHISHEILVQAVCVPPIWVSWWDH